jgi:hypothetical protein
LEEYSHCSGPDIFLSAAATMTKRIRVGRSTRVPSGWRSGRRSSTSSRADDWSWGPAVPRHGRS